MSIEFGSPVNHVESRPPLNDPMTAIGEAIYSPAAIDTMVNLSAGMGRALAGVVAGTLRIASMTTGLEGKPGSVAVNTSPAMPTPMGVGA